MQSDPSKPPSSKKPITKQWQPQASRTAKSTKKLLGNIDALKPLVQAHPGEKIHRAEVAKRVRNLLTAAATPREANANHHVLINMFFSLTFKYEVGQAVDLEWAWRTFLKYLDAHTSWAKVLNAEVYRQAFFWQIAGHTASTLEPLPKRVRLNDVSGYWVNGKFVPATPGHLDVPTFLCPGAQWGGEEVFAYTVKNMFCKAEVFEEYVRQVLKED